MAVEYALLGLLAADARHGYDLAREFGPDTPLGDIVHLEPSMLYAHLKRLERAGQIVASIEPQDSRPPRRVFSLTAAGHAALDAWLASPVEHTRDLRLEFLLKLYTARERDAATAAHLIAAQHVVCQRFVTSLTSQRAAETDTFRCLVLDMRLAQNRAILDWLQEASRMATIVDDPGVGEDEWRKQPAGAAHRGATAHDAPLTGGNLADG